MKKRTSIVMPQTTKSLMTKPPIGGTLAQKKKSHQVNPLDFKNDIKSFKTTTGGSHTRNKSAEKSVGKSKGMNMKTKTAQKVTSNTERGRGTFQA